MKDKTFIEHAECVLNYFLLKDRKDFSWLVTSLLKDKAIYIKLCKRYSQTPPGFILFTFFVYGINPKTHFIVNKFQQNFTRFADSKKLDGVDASENTDVSFDLYMFIALQTLENMHKHTSVSETGDCQHKTMIEITNLTLRDENRRFSKGLHISNLRAVLEELTPSKPRWSVQNILARQTSNVLN
jgi:hypothetical protein